MTLRISLWCLMLALAAVVLVDPQTFFPFIGIKAYWFRFWVSAAAVIFLWWYGFSANPDESKTLLRRLLKEPLFASVLGFVAAFLVSSALAADPHVAFWSNFERGEGGFQMLYYALFFALLGIIPQSRADWRLLLRAASFAALGVVIYGLLALLALKDAQGYPIFLRSNSAEPANLLYSRFAGSLGNPAYAGAYFLLALILSGFLFLWEQKKFWRIAAALFAVLFLAFLFFSQSRGALLGFLFLFAGILIYLSWRVKRFRILMLAVILASAALLSLLTYLASSTAALKGVPVFERVLRLSFSDRSFKTRFWVWEAALYGLKERPFFGWGPENFPRVYDAKFDIRHFVPGEPSDTWYDRAHNVLFDYAAETGLVGLASYLSIFAVFYWRFFKWREHIEKSEGLFFAALLFAFPIAYLAMGQLLFEVLPLYVSFFFFLGFAGYIFRMTSLQTL